MYTSNNNQVSPFERAPETVNPVLTAKFKRLSEVGEAIKLLNSLPSEKANKGFVLPIVKFGNENPEVDYSIYTSSEEVKTYEDIPETKPQKEQPIKEGNEVDLTVNEKDSVDTILDEDRMNSEEDRVAAARRYVEAVTRDL